MEENLNTLSKEEFIKIKKPYFLYLKEKEKLNHLKTILEECQNSMTEKIPLTKNGCILKSNIEKLEKLPNTKIHQIKGEFKTNYEITKLLIDNNEINSSLLKNPKYYNILFENKKEKLKKVIIYLISTLALLALSSINIVFNLPVIITTILSMKQLKEYIYEKPINSPYCGKLTHLKLHKFKQCLKEELEREKKYSIEIHNYNMSFLAFKEKVLISMIEKEENIIHENIREINNYINIDKIESIEKVISQKPHQLIKKPSLH